MKYLITILAFMMFAVSHGSETVKGVQKDFASFKKEMSDQLDTVEKKLAELKDKAQKKGGETKEKSVQELEATRDQLKAELGSMKDDGKKGWMKFKKSLATGIESLNGKIQKALKD